MMLNTLRIALPTLPMIRASPIASSSRQHLPSFRPSPLSLSAQQMRFRSSLAPRRFRTQRAQKGLPIHLPTGGSIRGTTLKEGQYGIRILESVRLSGDVLSSCLEALKRKTRPMKGCRVYLRTFPSVPVCVKGNETRMGKGKGSFEFWSARVPAGRVVFEIGGGGIREEVAKAAFALAQVRLPVKSEFITLASPPRLGSIASHSLTSPVQRLAVSSVLAPTARSKQGLSGADKTSQGDSSMKAMAEQAEGLSVKGEVVGAAAPL